MFRGARRSFSVVVAVAVGAWAAQAFAGSFNAGNLVVTRVGASTVGAGGNAASVTIDEYSGTTRVNSIALPTTGADAFTLPDVGGEDGHLTVSADGKVLVVAGYNASVGTAGVAAVAPSLAPRTVAVIKRNGTYDVSTKLTDAGAWPTATSEAKVLRGVATTDGTKFWLAGDGDPASYPAGGVRFATLGSNTSVSINKPNAVPGTTYVNVRSATIADGQLYTTSGSSSVGKGVQKVGVGLPESGENAMPVVATDGNSVNQAFFADLDAGIPGVDTLYTIGKSFCKYALVGGAWVKKGTFASGELPYLAANVTPTGVDLYVGGYSSIFHYTDTNGYNTGFSFSAVTPAYLTAGANESFRGISFAPVPEPATMSILGLGVLAVASRRRSRKA